MPRKNVVKFFLPGAIYHAYNRGVDKRNIFQDKKDYQVFLYYLKNCLSPPPPDILNPKSIHKEVQLICFCLMPNHFHLLAKQITKEGMTKMSRQLFTRYSSYFNKKYNRTGTLFESSYKAVQVDNESQLIHLSRYIHLNPKDYQDYPYSSYKYFTSKSKPPQWLHPQIVLDIFKSNGFKTPRKTYKEFVSEYTQDDFTQIQHLALEKGLSLSKDNPF